MDRQLEKRLSDRAVAIGREGDVAAFDELIDLLRSSSANARRLSASALAKLAFQRVFCDRCFDEVFLERRHVETQYKMSMYKKQTLYQQEGKRLISVYPADLPRLGALLAAKLHLFGYSVGTGERSEVSEHQEATLCLYCAILAQ